MQQDPERKGAQRNDEGHVADPHWPRDLRLHVLKEFRVDLQDGCSVAILRELLHFEILAELLGQNRHLLLLNQLSNVRREVIHDRAAGSAYGQLCVAPPTLLVRSTLGTVSWLWSGRVKDDQHAEKAVAVQQVHPSKRLAEEPLFLVVALRTTWTVLRQTAKSKKTTS